MNGPNLSDHNSRPYNALLNPLLINALTLLNEAASQSNPDAIYLLADLSFHAKYGHPRNYTQAFHNFQELADLTGNATAQHYVGFMHATGIGNVVEKDQAKALLYHSFAAEAGNTRSQMTTAYRHHAGIATPRDCEASVIQYKKVADKAMRYVRSGPPGGQNLVKEAFRFADEHGGIYGEGASASSAGHNAANAGPISDAHADFDNVLEYLDLMSRKGELRATFKLGLYHYEGSRALKQDFGAAKDYFLDVARRYWTKDGKIKPDLESGIERIASKAAAHLGRMFLRGEGMEQNFTKAKVWFKRGIDNGEPLCQYSMGLMHLHALGMPRNAIKAADFFSAAADQDLPPAQVRMGALLLDQGDLINAIRYFEIAARHGNIEAFYYLAEVSNMGIGRDRSCSTAALYYKIVSEKAERIHSFFGEANDAYDDGDVDTALHYQIMAAEQGYEIGQANVAYLLDKQTTTATHSASNTISLLRRLTAVPYLTRRAHTFLTDTLSAAATPALALIYWTRSAKQANIDSLVKMGDYYLLGLGTNAPDADKAATCYTAAAETLQSAQAMWNLGWMHENGIGGLAQDFHLAKRYYDQSLETNAEAYLPVSLALMRLRLRSSWNTLSGGAVNPIQDEPRPATAFSLREWVAQFLAADLEQYYAAEEAWGAGRDGDGDEWETLGGAQIPGGEEYYEGEYEGVADGVAETLVIVGLAAMLAALVWWRQQRALQERRRLERHGEEAALQDRGLFPAPAQPEFQEWVAGGIAR